MKDLDVKSRQRIGYEIHVNCPAFIKPKVFVAVYIRSLHIAIFQKQTQNVINAP